MIVSCPTCKEVYRPAKSKRESPCTNCLSIEKTGKSLKEIAREKHRESMERSRLRSKAKSDLKPKTVYVIKNRSAKGAKQEREITKVKRELTEAALDGGFCQCEGCGGFFDTIDRSHKIPLSKSSELAAMPGNIRLFCRECHLRWESSNAVQMIELNCLVEDMQFLLDFDPERFWKIHFRLIDEYNARPTHKLGRLISELEKLE